VGDGEMEKERRVDVHVRLRLPEWSKPLACVTWMHGKRGRAAGCRLHSSRQTAPRHTDRIVYATL